jgi:hypothetical protein
MNKQLERFKTLRVLVVIPSTGLWFADFGTSLVNMMSAFAMFRVGNFKQQIAQLANYKGSILSKSRYLAVEEAKKGEFDYLLFIDSDQTFPRKTLHKLIACNQDVVAANIATKQIPASPTARNKGPRYEQDKTDWTPVYTDEESSGLERVDRVGAGIVMFSKKVLHALKPSDWDMRWREDVKAVQGEDWSMMEALEREGFKVYIDHDLSQLVGHVGFYTFTHRDVGEVRPNIQQPQGELDVRDSEPRAA